MKYFNRHRLSEHRPLSDINVTPLVDVVLVLLIIFMVTAPMLQMGIDVNLPKVKAKSVDITEEKLVLTIDGGRRIFLNKKQIPLPDLKPKLEAIFQDRIDREIYMRADKGVPYGFVVEVMSEIRKAGVDRLGMVTEPPQETVE
ncbi:MAG TPA: biopolymer transporter ExbD [Syntrophales bacterium]|jgi:biopolymer transport protein TolR|nr:biopolymer transporter ExbD [Syntrophales bacterium]HQA82513.1 biopolymer transporter ExbD [Syntrophales bacterium]